MPKLFPSLDNPFPPPDNVSPSISRTSPLKSILSLSPPCSCAQCRHGCTMGSGLLVETGLRPLAEFFSMSEDALKEKFLEEVELFGKKHFRPKILRKNNQPYGKCIFFDSKERRCKVHPVKPLQCKVAMGCKPYGEQLMLWFQENYLVDWKDPKSIKEFEVYLRAGGKKLKPQ